MEDKEFMKKMRMYLIASCNMDDATAAMFTANLGQHNIFGNLMHYLLFIWSRTKRQFDINDKEELKNQCLDEFVQNMVDFGFTQQEANALFKIFNKFEFEYVKSKAQHSNLVSVAESNVADKIVQLNNQKDDFTLKEAMDYITRRYPRMSEYNRNQIRKVLEGSGQISKKKMLSFYLVFAVEEKWFFNKGLNKFYFEIDNAGINLDNGRLMVTTDLKVNESIVTKWLCSFAHNILKKDIEVIVKISE